MREAAARRSIDTVRSQIDGRLVPREVREYTEGEDRAPAEGFGSLADKLRGALEPREK